jgi:hypothetical protein
MKKTVLAIALATLAMPSLAAKDHWSFGIGTGLSSLNLDGDVGFATEEGGIIEDLDLDNGDTADMFESAFGFGSFANKGPLTIHFSYATLTLEDDNRDWDVEWDKAEGELAVEYTFTQLGNHYIGAIGGVRYIDHEWEFKNKETKEKTKPEDDWTDAVIGLTHRVPITETWAWSNRADYGFGDSEGVVNLKTTLNWKPLDHWLFNFSLRYEDIEYGEKDDINDNDFYYYDVEEVTIGAGFVYVW